MNKGIWEETIRKNAHEEGMGPCDRDKRGVCTEEGKGLPVIKGRERRSV